VQAFGGAEGVEDFDVEALTETFEKRRRKRFARGNSVADAGEIEVGAAGAVVIEKRGVVGGHGEKERGAISLDIGVNAGGRGATGGENRGCATGKREVAGVAETVGEKEAGDTKAAVAFGDFEDGVSVVVRADDHVVMKVHAALGNACGTRGVKPECGVIFGCWLGGEVRRGSIH